MAKSITEKELNLIFPEEEVEIAGHVFTLRPFSFLETKIVAQKLHKVLHLFVADDLTTEAISSLYGDTYDGIRDVIAMSLKIDPNLVDKFDTASALRAITHIIKINKNFFSVELTKEAEDLMTMFQEAQPAK